ncbi:MAG TPA: hypothetical protein VEZ44_07610 [bacterium]|nr:hypothetical protein [bacterium]
MTHEAIELHALLHRIAVRTGIAAAWGIVARAGAAAGGGLLLWALATMIVPVPFPLGRSAVALGAILAATWSVLVWRCRPSASVAAQIADRRAGLCDRLSTAVELLARSPQPAGLARLQVADAVIAAQGVEPRAVAPLRVPRETWLAGAACLLLLLWAHFLVGWSLPATPAAKALAVVHREGQSVIAAGRRLEAVGRSQALPEAQRLAPQVQALGRRLEGPRVDREQALGLLRDVGRQLGAAQDLLQRQLDASLPQTNAPGASSRPTSAAQAGADGQRLQRLDAAVRQVRALTGQLERGGAPVDPQSLSTQLRALAESLDQMNAPVSTRERINQARQEAAQGHLSAASGSLNEAMQDLQGLERMVGDEQALGDARQNVQQSAARIAEQGPLGGANVPVSGEPSPSAPPPQASGPNPPSGTTDETGAPPPPGPNQGSLPGQGTGPQLGAATPRLQGTRVQVHVQGVPGEGPSSMREIVAPGQGGTSRLPAGRPPAAVAHELDRAMSEAPLPPTFLQLVRQYFETQGGTP